jgi:hypothetical protein
MPNQTKMWQKKRTYETKMGTSVEASLLGKCSAEWLLIGEILERSNRTFAVAYDKGRMYQPQNVFTRHIKHY